MKRILITFLLLVGSAALGQDVVFRANGAGLWVEQHQKSELVVVMEMKRETSNELTLTIRPINGIPKRFTGRAIQDSNSSYSIAINKSGKLSASGTIHVENDPSGSVKFLIGSGTVAGRRVAFQFTKNRPLRWNSLSFGEGTLSWASSFERVRLMSLICTKDDKAQIALLSDNGQVRQFSANGPATRVDANTTAFSLSEAENVFAAGSVNVQRDRAGSQIMEAAGSGSVGSERFAFTFRAEETERSSNSSETNYSVGGR